MKQIYYLLLLILFTGCASTSKTSTIENIHSFPDSLYISVLKAKIMQQPTKDSRILDHLPMGAKVKVIQQYDNWFRVAYRGGKTGWVYKGALAMSDLK